MRQAFGRGMGAMGGREGIVDIDVAQFGERIDEFGIVLFLALMKPRIFEKQIIAIAHRGNGGFGGGADAVVGEGDLLAQFLFEFHDDGAQRKFLVAAIFGPAEMGQHDDLGALLRKLLQVRQNAIHAGRIRYLAAFHGHIQVDAHKHPFAGDLRIVKSGKRSQRRGSRHASFPIATAVSAIRLENPHSLSYQETTRTKVPSITRV